MHAKHEFIYDAIQSNPWNSTHFAWVDFNIYHIFKTNPQYADQLFRTMCKRDFQQESFLAIPGCWNFRFENPEVLINHICWRFCGGFFIGAKQALLEFHALYRAEFGGFLQESRALTWEVNFWSWLEYTKPNVWQPTWYYADHNESMLEIFADCVCPALMKKAGAIRYAYAYPEIRDLVPSSTSHHFDPVAGKHVLNTRFVNYTICDNGAYHIMDPQGHIRTRNFCAVLDDLAQIPDASSWVEMQDRTEMPCYGDRIYGLEDIRLFSGEEPDSIHFVASNMNYHPEHKIRILRGVYDISQKECRNVRMLHPPSDTYCEKNWIPVGMGSGSGSGSQTDRYIYKWSPFEIGEIDPANGQMRIAVSIAHDTPYFKNVRGSSCFVAIEEGWLGVVNFSEECSPRHYYHMLVLLDKTSYFPLKYSNMFCFHRNSIEFCTGFAVDRGDYMFWISNFDRDPEGMKVPREQIRLEHMFSNMRVNLL
jgi:hypothetical protein